MTTTMLYVLCVVIGGATGLRSMTGIALVTVGAHQGGHFGGWLHLTGTRLSFLARPVTMYIFLLLALGELIADKLPVPSRITPGPLAVRAIFGGLCASALAAAAGQSWILPALLGAVAAIGGGYAGYWLRRTITSKGVPDLPIALVEDATAILLAWFAVSRFGA